MKTEPERCIEQGIRYFQAGNIPGAIGEYRAALALDPGSVRALYNLGLAEKAIRNVEEAIKLFDRVIYLDMTATRAYVAKGNLLFKHGLYRKAGDCYDSALALDPSQPEVWWNKALLFEILGLSSESARSCAAYRKYQKGSGVQATPAEYLRSHQIIYQQQGSIRLWFPYTLRGKEGCCSLMVSEEVQTYLLRCRRVLYVGENMQTFFLGLLNDGVQRKALQPLVAGIRAAGKSDPEESARVAVNLVQQIPYHRINRVHHRPFYPYEVLYNQRGVCGDKSLLLAFLLKELGFEVALLIFDRECHMALGIRAPPEYCYKGTGYAFIEATTPSIMTDGDGDYRQVGQLTSMPSVISLTPGPTLTQRIINSRAIRGGTGIPLTSGLPFTSIKEEFNDNAVWQHLNRQGKILPPDQYRQWRHLWQKYGMRDNRIPL